MYVLAHLSDPHLAPMPKPQPLELIGKRAVGYVNWRRNRHKVHRIDVLARLLHEISFADGSERLRLAQQLEAAIADVQRIAEELRWGAANRADEAKRSAG